MPDLADALVGMIESRFGLPLDTSDVDHLRDVERHYRAKREAMLAEAGEPSVYARPDYAKAVLISEAARILIREIAPKRRKNREDKR